MGRPALAFLIAPVWVPLVVAPYAALELFPYAAQAHWVVISTIISAVFAYSGTLVVGVPAYLFLRSRDAVSIWVSLAVGFLIGALVGVLFLLCFALLMGQPIGQAVVGLANDLVPKLRLAAMTGGLGALVGVTAWFIGRPRVTRA